MKKLLKYSPAVLLLLTAMFIFSWVFWSESKDSKEPIAMFIIYCYLIDKVFKNE